MSLLASPVLEVLIPAWTVFTASLVVGAVWDVCKFRIPNWIPAFLAISFAALAVVAPVSPSWKDAFTAAIIVLVIGGALFYFGVMGGGDVKLLSAVALWVGTGALLPLAGWVSMVGGCLGIVLLIGRGILNRLTWVSVENLPQVLRRGEPVPYAVAICLGSILTALSSRGLIF